VAAWWAVPWPVNYVIICPIIYNKEYLSIFNLYYILAKEAALRGISILLLEGGPDRKQYDLNAMKDTHETPYSNRVSAVSKSSVKLLQSIGAWQIIEDLGRCNAVKEMRVSI